MAAADLAGATYAFAVENVNGKCLLKDDYQMVTLDGRHRRRSVRVVRDEDSLKWATEPLGVWYAFCIDEKPISLDQAIKLSKIAEVSTFIVSCKTTFTNTIQGVLNSTRAFEDYGKIFVDLSVLDIVDDMMSSNVLDENPKATYTRYMCVGKMMMKIEGKLSLLVSLSMDAVVAKALGITHLIDPELKVSSEKYFILVIQVAETSPRALTIPLSSMPAHSIDKRGPCLTNFTFVIWSKVKKNFHALRSFFQAKIHQKRIITHKLLSRFNPTMDPFNFYASDNSKKGEAKADMYEKRLQQRVDRHFNPTEEASLGKSALDGKAQPEGPQKKRMWSTSTSTCTAEAEVIDLDDLDQGFSPPEEISETSESSRASWTRRIKDTSAEKKQWKNVDKTTTSENPAHNDKSLKT